MLHNCASCRNALMSHFKIARVDDTGVEKGAVQVCSILCLLRWGYGFGISRGVAGVMTAKNTFDALAAALRGGR